MGAEDEPDWASIARHGRAIATVCAFLEGSGAERVAVVLDPGGGAESVLLESLPGVPVEVTAAGATYLVPAEATSSITAYELDVPRAPPGTAMELDLDQQRVLAPVGVIAALADAVLALARELGGRTVASADFATNDPERPLTIAARAGEGVVLAAGDQQFEL
ncbi:MAG TPA: hypothetical protein VF533_13895 [Solirubrobacteraceae bacterium]